MVSKAFAICIVYGFFVSCGNLDSELITHGVDVQFSFENLTDPVGRNETVNPAAVVVTIEQAGQVVYSHEKLELYSLPNGTYISTPLKLKSGSYDITDFFVINEDREIIYLSPKTGSEFSYLVERPLPIEFNVGFNEGTSVICEVVVPYSSPQSYGYAEFGFGVKEFVFIEMSVFEKRLDGLRLTTAELLANGYDEYGNHVWFYEQNLESKINSLRLPIASRYILEIRKCGYLVHQEEIIHNNEKIDLQVTLKPSDRTDFVNGSFETANFCGWQVYEFPYYDQSTPELGAWFVLPAGTYERNEDRYFEVFDHHDQVDAIGCRWTDKEKYGDRTIRR